MPTDPVNREPLCCLPFYLSVKEPKQHGKEIKFSQNLLEEEANRIRIALSAKLLLLLLEDRILGSHWAGRGQRRSCCSRGQGTWQGQIQ